ncbi:MAG: hypothetical protein IKR91_06115 [Alloprevotella sp.]|nr:hypothetical protein [Alloprevotella sp.]
MKDTCKAIYNWFQTLVQSIISLLSVALFSSRSAARDVRKLAEKEKRHRCIILGTGPSMQDTMEKHLSRLKTEDTLVVNMFCNSPYFFDLKPKYYVLVDPRFFYENVNFPRIVRKRKELLEALPRVDWPMTLFLPSILAKSSYAKKLRAFPSIDICFYNLTPVDGFIKLNHYLFRKNLGMPTAQNVTCGSVFLMTNLGYEEIYMVGAEHDWLDHFYINNDNQLIMGDKHFYGDEKIIADKTLSTWLGQLRLVFRCYERLAEYAAYRGTKVYNSTPNSHIDSFERKPLF